MGYYITLEESTWFLPAIHYDQALGVLKGLNDYDHLKGGGSSDGEKWFSWMPSDYDKTVESVEEVFELLGFECSEDEGVGLRLEDYYTKSGDEEIFLRAVCHFATGHLIWRGEDGVRWKVDYTGITPKLYKAEQTWVREPYGS